MDNKNDQNVCGAVRWWCFRFLRVVFNRVLWFETRVWEWCRGVWWRFYLVNNYWLIYIDRNYVTGFKISYSMCVLVTDLTWELMIFQIYSISIFIQCFKINSKSIFDLFLIYSKSIFGPYFDVDHKRGQKHIRHYTLHIRHIIHESITARFEKVATIKTRHVIK